MISGLLTTHSLTAEAKGEIALERFKSLCDDGTELDHEQYYRASPDPPSWKGALVVLNLGIPEVMAMLFLEYYDSPRLFLLPLSQCLVHSSSKPRRLGVSWG